MAVALPQHALGDVARQDGLPRRRLLWLRRHECAEPSPYVDRPFGLERAIRVLNRVDVDFQLLRELSGSGQRFLRLQDAHRDASLDLVGNLAEDRTGIPGGEVEGKHEANTSM